MTGNERRKAILGALRGADRPLSGDALGRQMQVSRQVIVQDIALLRAQDHEIVSTNRGYVLLTGNRHSRMVKCRHTVDQAEDELTCIVDAGGTVENVVVNHRAYGPIEAPLHISSRRDVQRYMDDIRSGKSSPLLLVTSGYHFHRIAADSEEVLDEIEAALSARGYLAEVLPYEQGLRES